MLYRVTITTTDGFTFDLPRQFVYNRAEQLGLMKPILVEETRINQTSIKNTLNRIKNILVHGNSAIANHMKEGVVVWYQETDGSMNCLKYKSEEFFEHEDALKTNNIGDVEDLI